MICATLPVTFDIINYLMFSKIYDEKILRFSPRKDTVFFFIKKPILFKFYKEVFAFAKAY
ncbi:hypothetical protein GCM10011344_24570 [Dokdonia pacifica]|nr:hypothetical protein GCM10011344_24570 [Dokdonia pacifica]